MGGRLASIPSMEAVVEEMAADEETREPLGAEADIDHVNNNYHSHHILSTCHLLGTVLTALYALFYLDLQQCMK